MPRFADVGEYQHGCMTYIVRILRLANEVGLFHSVASTGFWLGVFLCPGLLFDQCYRGSYSLLHLHPLTVLPYASGPLIESFLSIRPIRQDWRYL